jgi:predicted nuclease of predicted toxin-antitoxin system
VKLLLDEMWPPNVAEELCRRGHDVAAVAQRSDLRGLPDAAVFAAAQREQRAVVTENAADYRWLAADEIRRGRRHHGLILTTNRRFPRHNPRTAGRLVTTLNRLLASGIEVTNEEYWLS